MNCTLFYHLKQRIYVSELRGERHEAMRIEHELDNHILDCPVCNGLNLEPLASNLFKTNVFVKKEVTS